MGAPNAISVDEYLRTSFPDYDSEYRDGEIIHRALPDAIHGRAHALVLAFFGTRRLRPYASTRVKLREGLILIPDILLSTSELITRLPDKPPLAVIEILSPDDRWSDVHSKLEEYRAWGVPHVWLVDPYARRFYTCDAGLAEVATLALPEFDVTLTHADAFE